MPWLNQESCVDYNLVIQTLDITNNISVQCLRTRREKDATTQPPNKNYYVCLFQEQNYCTNVKRTQNNFDINQGSKFATYVGIVTDVYKVFLNMVLVKNCEK